MRAKQTSQSEGAFAGEPDAVDASPTGPEGPLGMSNRDELDMERISDALRGQVRAHPVRTLAIAALGGLILGKLVSRS